MKAGGKSHKQGCFLPPFMLSNWILLLRDLLVHQQDAHISARNPSLFLSRLSWLSSNKASRSQFEFLKIFSSLSFCIESFMGFKPQEILNQERVMLEVRWKMQNKDRREKQKDDWEMKADAPKACRWSGRKQRTVTRRENRHPGCEHWEVKPENGTGKNALEVVPGAKN